MGERHGLVWALGCAAALASSACARSDRADPDKARPAASDVARPPTSARSDPTATSSPLDATIRRCASQQPAATAECADALQRLAKKAALLEVGGIRHEATRVYFCDELTRRDRERDPWRCFSGLTASDDTLHTTEREHQVVALGAGERVRLVSPAGHPPAGLIKVGAGRALELNADGYVAARRLTVDRGATLSAGEIPAGRTVLLFALFRQGDRWVRKHVWVVQQPLVDAGR